MISTRLLPIRGVPALALALVLASAGGAGAADLRIGYVDSARLFAEYPAAREAQQRFDRQVEGWRNEASEKEKAVSQLRAEVRDQGPMLSALRRQEKEAALQRAIGEYESFIQGIWGPSGRAASENDAATRELVQQIRVAVEKIAADKALELVLDSAGGFIIYADRSMDITAEVLAELAARAGGQN